MSYKNYCNPAELSCFKLCTSCYRCADKGRYAKCSSCSGRADPTLKRDAHDIDDLCRCTEGVLQFRLQNGKLIQTRFPGNPFVGQVQTELETPDERDWNAYLNQQREKMNNPNWDPIRFSDGTSTSAWDRRNRSGT